MKNSGTYPVSELVVHQGPHFDELAGLWLIRENGEHKFPGAKMARIVTRAESGPVDFNAMLAAGKLYIGTGGGPFDEHKPGGRMKDECCATLVAKYLGLNQGLDDRRFRRIIEGVLVADTVTGPASTRPVNNQWVMLAGLVKRINRYSAMALDIERLYQWVKVALDADLAQQDEYLAAEKLVRSRVRVPVCGKTVVVGGDISNLQFVSAARNMPTVQAAVVIQQNPKGNIQIFGCPEVPMREIAHTVRVAEWHAMGNKQRIPADPKSEGTLPMVPQWYFEGDNLMNGSESYPDVPMTRLSLQQVLDIVVDEIKESRKVRKPAKLAMHVLPAASPETVAAAHAEQAVG